MLNNEELRFVSKNIDKLGPNGIKTILLHTRLNSEITLGQVAAEYYKINADFQEYFSEQAFGNPQPEGKE